MNFHEWYLTKIVPRLYDEQALYEQESVVFQELEKLSRSEALELVNSMSDDELKLALFDHVRNCISEKWTPRSEIDEFDRT